MTFQIPLTWGCQEIANREFTRVFSSGEVLFIPRDPFLVWKGLHLAGRGWVKLDISRFSQHPPV